MGRSASRLDGERGRAAARIPADLVQRVISAARHQRRTLAAVLTTRVNRFGNDAVGEGEMVQMLERPAVESAAGIRLQERLARREAVVGLIGLGYAGLPLAVAFAEAGFPVVGVDLNADRVEALIAGSSYLGDIPDDRLAPLLETERLQASTDYALFAEADTITICVPTPLSKAKVPDTSAIVDAVRALTPWLRPGQLIILESTCYPGTTETLVRPMLEEQGF